MVAKTIILLSLYLEIKCLFFSLKKREKGPEPEHFEWGMERELLYLSLLMGVWVGSGTRFKEIIHCLIIEW